MPDTAKGVLEDLVEESPPWMRNLTGSSQKTRSKTQASPHTGSQIERTRQPMIFVSFWSHMFLHVFTSHKAIGDLGRI